MVIGGTHWENNGTNWNRVWLNSPEFFSLKPSCDGGALPSCLNGTKTAIDSQERWRPALIKTDGKIGIVCNYEKLSLSRVSFYWIGNADLDKYRIYGPRYCPASQNLPHM